MKYFVYFCVLTALLTLALAQPVTQEPQELQSADQAVIESEGPTDLEQAIAQFICQEAEGDVENAESHSRQKRAACRCYRRARNVIVCYCR